MNLKAFRLNENRHQETSSVAAFFASYDEGESTYWIDIEQPEPAALTDCLSPTTPAHP